MTTISTGAEIQAEGDVISGAHLGANFLFNRESMGEGIGEDGIFDEAAVTLGITHVRYPGGTIAEHQFDLGNPENTFQDRSLITGKKLPNGSQNELTPLSEFLAYADAEGMSVSLVLPTGQYKDAFKFGGAALAQVEAEVKTFVQNLLTGPYAHTIHTFEIGNEWYAKEGASFGSAESYGEVASEMTEWVNEAIEAAGTDHDPKIAVQAGRDVGSTTASSQIIAEFSQEALDAIDGVIIHNYRPIPWDQGETTFAKIKHAKIFEAAVGRELDTMITEWNVGNGSSMDGLLQGSGIIDMFHQMMTLGMDTAHIWAILQGTTSRLAEDVLDSEIGPELMAGGEIFRQMIQSLEGTKALVGTSAFNLDEDAELDALLHVFGTEDGARQVAFASSLEGEAMDLIADLSALFADQPDYIWITQTGVAEGADPTSFMSLPFVESYSLSHLAPGWDGQLALNFDPYEIVRVEIASKVDGSVIVDSGSSVRDDLTATDIREVFVIADDDQLDLVRNFEVGHDRLDVSALGAQGISDLTIEDVLRKDGSVSWVKVIGPDSEDAFLLRFSPDTPMSASNLDATNFIFAAPGAVPQDSRTSGEVAKNVFIRPDSDAPDDIRAITGAEQFQLQNDGHRDVLRDFNTAHDTIDVSALNVTQFDDLVMTELLNGSGEVNWIELSDASGEAELILRFDDSTPLSVGALSEANFIFATEIEATVLTDTAGKDDLRGTGEVEIFRMLDDGQQDLVRNLELGKDKIDVSALGMVDMNDMSLSDLVKSNGSVSWVRLSDQNGESEMLIRFDGTPLAASALSADDFIFA